MAARRRGQAEAAVSSVVGTVLMLGITIAVFTGFSLFVFESFSADESQRLRTDLAVLQDGGRYLLQHRGGDALDLAEGRLLATVDGSPVDLPLTALAGQTADGEHWRIGETLCISGPVPPCQYDRKDVSDLRLTYGNAVVLSDSGFGATAGASLTYVTQSATTVGTVTDFAAARSTVDDADADLAEGGTSNPAGAASSTVSGTTQTSNSVTTPDDVFSGALSGDSGNLRAYLDGTGDWIEVTGFTAPSAAASITGITIGFEGLVQSTSGQLPILQLSYRVGATPGATTLSQTPTATTDLQYTQDVTADQPMGWAASDVNALTVRLEVTNSPVNRYAGVDHVYVTLQYTTAPTTTYRMDITMDVGSIPEGTGQVLQLRYHALDDAFRVQVWDGSSYVTRGVTLNAATSTSWSYTLGASEVLSGTVRLRFVDVAPAGTSQGHLFLDYVRVVTSP